MKGICLPKKRGALIALVGAIIVVGMGATFAISQSRSIFGDGIKIASYQVVATESFNSPTDWQPCQTIPKTITVTNNNDMGIAVRIKLDEFWENRYRDTIPLVSSRSGLQIALVNFTENSGWSYDAPYYVYDEILEPGATTTSLISGVTLNCEANLDTSANAEATADGLYANAQFHLKATIQTIQSDSKAQWKTLAFAIKDRANEPYEIRYRATADAPWRCRRESDPDRCLNGFGVNAYTENGEKVYYYRGEDDAELENYVYWANYCWRILRTTATGGVKMIYQGEMLANGSCPGSNNASTAIYNSDRFPFNKSKEGESVSSLADVGYKYGDRIYRKTLDDDGSTFVFSNNVSRNGNTYTLDTSAGQSISGTWQAQSNNAAVRYHYFCTNGASVCDDTEIGYIVSYRYSSSRPIITYLPVGGYDDYEAMKTAMFTNTHDSDAKQTIETWFEENNLDGHIEGTRNYEDDLEDAIFCNDRTLISGVYLGKDSDATYDENNYDRFKVRSYFAAYYRNSFEDNSQRNYEPSLDCTNPNDAFSVSNDRAKLKHKVGLITADELILSGMVNSAAFLFTGYSSVTMTPRYVGGDAIMVGWDSNLGWAPPTGSTSTMRPVVSLKAGTPFVSGTGAISDPFIVP
jgi:hypothetical protein